MPISAKLHGQSPNPFNICTKILSQVFILSVWRVEDDRFKNDFLGNRENSDFMHESRKPELWWRHSLQAPLTVASF